jgi:AcrR family transcriptional regulator
MSSTSAAPAHGYAKGRARREEIIEAAVAVFGEAGYRAASLREISARVGISHPGLLHHFPTKVALIQAVLDRRDAEDAALIDAEIAAGADLFESLVRLVERNAGRRPVVELFAALSAEAAAPDHPAHRHIVERYTQMVALCTGAFAEARDAGRLRPGIDPASAARTVVALMDGLQVQWLLALDGPGPQVDMAAEIRGWLALVLV